MVLHRILILSLFLMTSVLAQETLLLTEPENPAAGWSFDNGPEFPGAKGGLGVDQEHKRDGRASLKLSGDFTGGGKYVQAGRQLGGDASVISFWIKFPGSSHLTLRVIDATGQCHQFNLKLKPSDDWQNLTLPLTQFFARRTQAAAVPTVTKYESWGGKKDGKWHGPAKAMYVLISPRGDNRQVTAWLDEVKVVSTAVKPADPFKRDFETGDVKDFVVKGDVSIDQAVAFKGGRSLLLSRTREQIEQPIQAVSPGFPVSPGVWQVALAAKCDLDSPDNSYNGVAALELLGRDGKVLRTVQLADQFRQHNWQPASRKVEIDPTVAAARFRLDINKASGRFWVDELSATYLSPPTKKEGAVKRLLFATAQVGNLIFPNDPRTVKVTVDVLKPLTESQRQLTYVVQDYFGAEIAPAASVILNPAGPNVYEATFDLANLPLRVGPYYEIHAAVAGGAGDGPFRNYTSFAILPEAVTKQYKPEEIPFTQRSWDQRVAECIDLSDRLGVRTVNIWGGFRPDRPHNPTAPQIDRARKFGMGVIASAPTSQIERRSKGYEKWNEQTLRSGMRAWLEKFGDVRPLIITLGNEPHATDPVKVKEQVVAYQHIYNEVKAFDPSIKVIATSVGPVEEYFRQGYQNACDMYDFHIYEAPQNVADAVTALKALGEKYHAPKPVWTTEIGLNSQGMARHAVACDMVKKLSMFFAAGGQSACWFSILYPDPRAEIADQSTTAHNIFDCRWSRYAPKLEAVTYFNMINGIAVKKFVDEKHYPNGTRAYLFRDAEGRFLQVLWQEKGRADVGVPLEGVADVQLIRVTGERSQIRAGGRLTLSVGEDPILLLYEKGPEKLAAQLVEPGASIVSLPVSAVRGDPAKIVVRHGADAVRLASPAGWTSQAGTEDGQTTFLVVAPQDTNAREAQFIIPVAGGELYARIPVAGKLAMRVVPDPSGNDGQGGVKIIAANNAADVQVLTWKLELLGEQRMAKGSFHGFGPAEAYFTGPAEGTLTLKAGQTQSVVVPMAGVDAQAIYRVKASVADASGRTIERERYVGGFLAAPRAKAAPKLDGVLDEPDWDAAPAGLINQQRQIRMISTRAGDTWTGPEDLSATVKYLWDEKFLYVAVAVKDDHFVHAKADGSLWNMDGLQFLIDPAREAIEKPGKYDYSMGLGTKGPQAWCHLSADAGASTGEAKDITVAVKPIDGQVTYELAIPWTRLAPFKPAAGANLALTLALNEDDGVGRNGFMNWFGDVQGKSADFNGDIVLLP